MNEVNMAVAHDLLKEETAVKELPKFPLDNDPHAEATEKAVAEIGSQIKGCEINLGTLRIATQIREFVLQGVTLKNTLKDMEEVWLSLYTEDKRCPIVEQQATKVRAQLIVMYGVKLIKYINSIVGLDLVPLAVDANPNSIVFQSRNPADVNWKLDSVMLNIGSNRIKDHEHLFTLMMVNIFGVSEHFVKFALKQTWEGLRQLVIKTYDFDIGETANKPGAPTLYIAEKALNEYIAAPINGYDIINTEVELPVEFHW